MLDLDVEFLGVILNKGLDFNTFLSSTQVQESDFETSRVRRAFRFVVDHWENYKSLPSPELVQEVLGTAFSRSENPDFIANEFINRKNYKKVTELNGDISKHLAANDPTAAIKAIEKYAGLQKPVNFSGINTLFQYGEEVKQIVQDRINGLTGVPVPWPTMMKTTQGLWPGTFTIIAARPGTGKTMTSLLITKHVWDQGESVLFVSPEMPGPKIAMRYLMIASEMNARHVLSGNLAEPSKNKMFSFIDELLNEDGVWVMDSESDLTFGGIETAIREKKPSLVLIDSVYMLHVTGDKRERLEMIADWITKTAKRFKVPFIIIHQMNRDTVGNKKAPASYTADKLALTDQLVWDAEAIYLMEQDSDMRADRTMRFHIGKIRDGYIPKSSFDINWDLETMKFDELPDEKERKKDPVFDQEF